MSPANPRVLVLDDDDGLRAMLRHTLQHYGYDVHDSPDTEEAIRELSTGEYSAALVDVMMPGISGHGFMRATKDIPDRPPVVMMSGQAQLEDVVEGFHEGIAEFLIKPFSPKEAAAVVRRVIEQHSKPASPSVDMAPAPAQPVHETSTDAPPGSQTRKSVKSRSRGIVEKLKAELHTGQIKLPAPESLTMHLRADLERPEIEARDLAALLERIPNGAARVLHLARTPQFSNRGSRPSNLLEAVQRIGTRNIINVVRTILVQESVTVSKGRYAEPARRMWENMIATAAIARMLAEHTKLVAAESAYMLGLFHNVGELLILRLISDLEKKGWYRASMTDIAEEIVEHHAELGFVLCKAWELDELITTVTKRHHDAELYNHPVSGSDLQKLCALVVLANHVATDIHGPYLESVPAVPGEQQCRQILRLSTANVMNVVNNGKSVLEDLHEVFHLWAGQGGKGLG